VPGGYIVTNNHVVDPFLKPGQKLKHVVEYRGTFAFDTREPALRPLGERRDPFPLVGVETPVSPNDLTRSVLQLKLVNRDPLSDLAVLRVDAIRRDFLDKRLKYVEGEMERAALKFAPHTETEVGDDVVAVGFPRLFAGPPTVTKGIVSALNRARPDNDTFTDLIQTDAAINPGNSGGPLLDRRGRVVGVNTYSLGHLGTPGVGFARSARTAEPFVKMLQKGPIARPGPGFDAISLDADDTDLLGVPLGLLLTKIEKGGPAEKAGARPGDLIVSIGSGPVSRTGDLHNALGFAGRDSIIMVTVWRFPEAQAKELLENRQDGLKFLRIFQPDGAIKLDTIKKIDLPLSLK
jgi:S1-C subfamily serine protease